MIQAVRFALPEICQEVRQLVSRGRVERNQPIQDLARFYSSAEWAGIRQELCLHDYGLDNPVCELVASEDWPND